MSLNQDFGVKAEDKAKQGPVMRWCGTGYGMVDNQTWMIAQGVSRKLMEWVSDGEVDEESKVYQLLTQLAMELRVVGQEQIAEEVPGE